MNDQCDQDTLELEVSNFGPIVEAKIDLRPLTVFVGPSNTGKSYLAILIYALHRHFSGGRWPRRRRVSVELQMFRSDGNDKLRKNAINSIIALAKQTLEDKGKPLSDEDIILPEPVVEIIRSGSSEQGDDIDNEIGRCFGIEETGVLTRKGTKGAACITFRRCDANGVRPIDHRLTISARAEEFKTVIPEGTQMRIGIGGDDHPIEHLRRMAMGITSRDGWKGEQLKMYAWDMVETLIDHVRPQVVGPLDLPAFYLPADRTGVMHAHSVVVSGLIESATMTGLRLGARMPMLSGVLADFLGQLIELERLPYQRRRLQRDVSNQIENAILGGSIGVDRSKMIGYPQFTYKPKGWKDSLPLMNASSMVSELAPVVLYLRHIVRPGNVLIVEEPESHLHPAMQVEFTRQLAALVHAGIRVIVTTHSEWVLEELANIVRRSALSTPDRETTAGTKTALHPDQVGAWLFKQKKRPKGSVVQEVKLDDETGLYPTDYDVVSEELYNESANIFSRIQHEKTK